MASFIHVSRPSLTGEEIRAACRVLKSGWLTLGKETEKFEKELKAYLGASEVMATSSCTAALHLSLLAAGVLPGDEVITSPLTFAATGNAILYCQAKPVFADIDPRTGNIDPEHIAEKITPRTKALLPVHYTGLPCDMEAISKIAKKYSLSVVEDAAHALGAQYKGKKIGTLSPFTCFSFYATKNLTMIEGGALAFKNKKLLPFFRKLRLHGLSGIAWTRYAKEGSPFYRVEELGFKYNPTDVGAAIGRVQLKRFEMLQKKREAFARFYISSLSSISEILLPETSPEKVHAWHIFVIRLKKASQRLPLMAYLKEKRIITALHFPPLHLQPLYRKQFGFRPGLCPQAEDFSRRCLTLPLHPALKYRDCAYVVNALKAFFARKK